MDFSLFYFDGDGSVARPNQYELLIESAKFADVHGFTAVWTPERHFHSFGGLYPNPTLTSAALAMITERVQLRAGSFVLPLHDPVRATEEWAVVDNLSHGRVAIAFASGWTVDDFVLAREPHNNRKAVMWRDLEVMRKLWRGEAVERQDATGKSFTVKTLPRPVQNELPVWMTCQSSETFVEAGKLGTHVLTSLLGGTLNDIVPKIQLYRKSLAKHGHDPQSGKVALMIHTFLGDDINDVKAKVTQPFCNYLKTHYDLLENLAKGMGLNVSIKNFSEDDIDSLLQFGVEGFMKGRSLIGTPASCLPFVEQIRAAGVDEIACLIDFVQDYDLVMASLPFVSQLQQLIKLTSENRKSMVGQGV
ncbi:LLM class flavin-dependent oxidoreductase [Nostoc sp. UHCC 0870]|uniref:LLM class flavin-dependent oxidoreductase n=1 Tax=Nostoc sp. UHCC 0870 TaxID=2914041 RepID=UPI001EE0CAEF|nr:LLM class flavin-dependent oxidoreductase [Nostoc sp. UHCC 0870]UKP00602.1 LLM class flavin-dependent oxidoreductase [Nostoc sp. UHCC 0870]